MSGHLSRLTRVLARRTVMRRGLAVALEDQGVPSGGVLIYGSRASSSEAASSADAAAGAEPADEQAAAASAAPAAAGPSALAAGQIDFSSSPKMVMIFTCSICETRAAKAFSKASYERGIVIVDCPGCHKKHLVADHLGWLGQKGNLEDFAAKYGKSVIRRTADDTLELTLEDLAGGAASGAVGSSAAAQRPAS